MNDDILSQELLINYRVREAAGFLLYHKLLQEMPRHLGERERQIVGYSSTQSFRELHFRIHGHRL